MASMLQITTVHQQRAEFHLQLWLTALRGSNLTSVFVMKDRIRVYNNSKSILRIELVVPLSLIDNFWTNYRNYNLD